MSSVNLQILIGNLGRNPEIRSIDGNRSKASFSLATNRTYKNREGQTVTNTYWHNVVVWDPNLIEIVKQHFTTGKQVLVEGESTTRSYQDRNGNTQYMREIKATRLIPIDQIEEVVGTSTSINKGFVIGPLAEKPLLHSNEIGEVNCTLLFKTKTGTLPIILSGPKAEIATKYLDAERVAHVNYEIVSTNPFKAVGLDLTLLGQRPSDQQEEGYAVPRQSEKKGNVINNEPSDSELDDLPF